jgi:hypothetical protein
MKEIARPSQNYSAGTRIFDVSPTAQRKFVGANCIFTRENWPDGLPYTNSSGMTYPNTALVVQMHSSLDGVNWQEEFDFPFFGGVFLDRQGVEVTEAKCLARFPERDGDIRFTIINLVPLRTAVTCQMLEPGDV